MMDRDPIRDLATKWRDRAEAMRRYGADGQATALAACADDLEALTGGARPSERADTGQADLTVAQVAERWGLSGQAVRDRIRRNELEGYKFGKRYRISHAAPAEYEERQRNGDFKRETSSEPPPLSKCRDG